ncbi:hypothetical protein [Aquibium sp. ELW1220]|uniref:hypothetical protein n=1 Tax=Aquibium sp. ELW1220 TaxID=2976766 RepID=UPI0025B0897A|nr:hypothetical protein [Aquibium sp. ELW1220]MDN2583081.1 hypothetical protein [Aquibium sp. ELW1220]
MTFEHTHVYINLPIGTVLGQAPFTEVERIDEDRAEYHLFEDPDLGQFALTCDTEALHHENWTELLHEAGPEAEPIAKTLVRLGVSPAQIEGSTGPSGEYLAPIKHIRVIMQALVSKAGSARTRPSAKQNVA